MNKKIHVKKDDTVVVISGDDKGKQGKVVEVSPKEGKVIVNGVNIVSKHVKPRRQGETGGIVKVEGAMYADKVALFCSNCNAGVRTKIVVKNDKKIRVCAKCGKEI